MIGHVPSPQERAVKVFEGFVGHGDYPCLGARSVLKRRRVTVRAYAELGAAGTAPALLADLRSFAESTDPQADLVSFVAIFQGPRIEGEQQFEELLWQQLQLLNDLDPEPWNPSVSPDPADPHFGFSAAGTAFFVVGLHVGLHVGGWTLSSLAGTVAFLATLQCFEAEGESSFSTLSCGMLSPNNT